MLVMPEIVEGMKALHNIAKDIQEKKETLPLKINDKIKNELSAIEIPPVIQAAKMPELIASNFALAVNKLAYTLKA